MASTTQVSSAAPYERRGLLSSLGRLSRRPEAGSFIGMLGVFVFFAIIGGEGFVSIAGLSSWLNVAAEVGIVALPIGLLVIAGELDMSIGAIIPASSLCVAIASGHFHLPEAVGIALALGIGLLVGFVNGFLVLRTEAPSQMRAGALVAIETSVNIAYAYDIRGEVIGETGVVTLAERNNVVVKANGTFSGRVPADWRERFVEAFDAEFRAWIAAAKTDGAAGPSAWDGYVATVTSGIGVRAIASGGRELITLRDRPALYSAA